MPGKPVFHEKIAASGAASELNIPNQRAINLENPGAVWDRFAKGRFGKLVYIYIYISIYYIARVLLMFMLCVYSFPLPLAMPRFAAHGRPR